MKTFAQFIAEGRDAPLYHGSRLTFALTIVQSGKIEGRTVHMSSRLGVKSHTSGADRMVNGISTTRNIRYAMSWSEHYREDPNPAVVFEFDQRKIAHNFQIRPIDYFSFGGFNANPRSEAEEFIITPVLPIEKYLTGIYVNLAAYKELERNAKYYGDDYEGNFILKHPKYKGIK